MALIMMFIIRVFYLVLVHYLPRFCCNNVGGELTGGDILLKEHLKENSNAIHHDHEKPHIGNKKIESFKREYNSVMRADSKTIKGIPDIDFVKDFEALVQANGCLKLGSLGHFIEKNVNEQYDLKSIMVNVTENYKAKIASLFKFVGTHKIINEIDIEFYYLDVIELTNEVFLNEAEILLDYIFLLWNINKTEEYDESVKEEVTKTVSKEKIDNLNYICQNINICRSYPAYSDYVAKVLSEVLKLPTEKFEILVKLFSEIINDKEKFFKNIMDDDLVYRIRQAFKSIFEVTSETKRFFAMLHTLLTNRHKLFQSDDEGIRSKAIRILIDMIDSAFHMQGETFINGIKYNNIEKSLKSWSNDEKNDIYTILADIIDEIFVVPNHYWDSEAKEEAKVLIELIVTGASANEILFEDLMKKGSRFVRSERIDFYNYLFI